MTKVHHMVLLKFKAGQESQFEGLMTALEDLRRRLPGFVYFTGGPYSSPEGANQGFTHGFLMTFDSTANRDHYLFHDDHEAVKSTFLPFVENVIAFDYVAGE